MRLLRTVGYRAVAASIPLVFLLGGTAFAQSGSGIPKVQYGTSVGGTSAITDALQNLAATIRDLLGATALVALVIAALVNHFVHSTQAKQLSKEIIVAAVVGMLIAIFAPTIVNFVASI